MESRSLSAATNSTAKINHPAGLQKSVSASSISLPLDRILFLQKTIGNRAVGRLMREHEPDVRMNPVSTCSLSSDESKIRMKIVGNPPRFQRFEGNRTHQKELRNTFKITPLIQRRTDDDVSLNIERNTDDMRGGGRTLSGKEMAFFEPRFGVNLRSVRLHADGRAGELADVMHAKAFTVGNDIAFGKGQYSPDTSEGKRLVAHERTHVVQQSSADRKIQRACGEKDIGRPEGCSGSSPVFVSGPLFRFVTSCDDFEAGQEAALLQHATTLAPNDVIEIHGFASTDGSAVFNRNLACARAIKAREVLVTAGGIQRTNIAGIFNHGPTPGPAADRRSVVIRSRTRGGGVPLSFVVHSMNITPGRLDDPDQAIEPGRVSWPLSFAVDSPITAGADVEVLGSASDPCARYQIGFLQTVYQQWLNIYYWGRQRTDGYSIVRYTVALPIRDGERRSMWYLDSDPGMIRPTACNVHVNPSMGDYPTIFSLPKVRRNSQTRQSNHLGGVTRGMYFATTLVASGPGGVIPLRHFRWDYLMDIDFTPNYADANAVWPFSWNQNIAHPGTVQPGRDNSVTLFTTATPTYNQSLAPRTDEFQ